MKMRPSPGSNNNPNANNQVNMANNGGSIFANNGGRQRISINHGPRRRLWTWYVLAGMLLLDIAYFFYGQSAYTGNAGNSGDLSRALIFFALFVGTVALLRACLRDLFGRR
jgi:drug/metabolite transporter (DMT)-like permease